MGLRQELFPRHAARDTMCSPTPTLLWLSHTLSLPLLPHSCLQTQKCPHLRGTLAEIFIECLLPLLPFFVSQSLPPAFVFPHV